MARTKTLTLVGSESLAGREIRDVWAVNEDAEYHESGDKPLTGASGLRRVPARAAVQ